MTFTEHRTSRTYVSRYRDQHDADRGGRVRYAWATLRILLGSIFAWAFADKAFGLGHATEPAKAWIRGGSPTLGFLSFGTRGPFAETFQGMAGDPFVDALFMAGLAGVGIALLSGIGVRVAAASGVAMMALMYAAALPPENHPFVDEHVVYAVVLVGIALARAGATWGLGRWWSAQPFVARHPMLE